VLPEARLPNLNSQIGFTKLRMGYNWDTTLFVMVDIVGVHNFPYEIEKLVGKSSETKLLYKKQPYISLLSIRNQFYNTFFQKKRFYIQIITLKTI
jgi:hypothetical protein